jgi:hypothetical protein
VIWIISPPLLLFAGAYVIRDLVHVATRKQALLALVFWNSGRYSGLALPLHGRIGSEAKEKATNISVGSLYLMPATTYAPTHLARAVPSALRGLTSVFGMGTGGSPAVRSPTT